MSIAEVSLPTSVADLAPPGDFADAAVERRWTDWKARGRAHERATRQKVTTGGLVAAILAVAGTIVYVLAFS